MSMNAQTVTDYVTGLSGPRDLLLHGNDLYIAETNSGKILKVDITQATPTPIELVTGLSSPRALALDSNTLYIGEHGNDRVMKIDITQSTPTLELVANVITPYSLVIAGNELFVAESFVNKISKIDLTDTQPAMPTDVISGLGYPQSITINGNDLYISEADTDVISKIDITEVNPTKVTVFTTSGSPFYMKAINDRLYFTEIINDKLAYLDVNAAIPTTSTDVVTGINGAYGFVYNGTDLYVGALFDNKIVKVENSLSVDEENISDFIVYPNPTKNNITIAFDSVVNNDVAISIIDILGRTVIKNKYSSLNNRFNETISLSSLNNGVYLISIKQGNKTITKKMIKN
jgi:hypothetical protein